jgi:hypothetical protein
MEQDTAISVPLLEAAGADLDLLSEYIDAERAVMYSECIEAHTFTARDRTLGRVGKNLRLVNLLESEAVRIANLPGASTASWYPRYLADRQLLAGQRTRTLQQLQLAASCTNPLDISEQELPLYVGEAVGPNARFFASSHFLTDRARQEIAAAEALEASAHDKYVAQREQAYQFDQARDTKTLRVAKLSADYESSLRRYCGTPAGPQTLLDGFRAGTFTADNCLFKTAGEAAECAGIENMAVADIPATCLRGQLGERIISIQSAMLDAKNASNSLQRSQDQYASDMGYCAQRQEFLHETETITDDFNNQMRELRAFDNSFLGTSLWTIEDAFSHNWHNVREHTHDLRMDIMNGDLPVAEQEQREREDYDALVQKRSHDADVADCYHKVDDERFAITSAQDTLTRASQQVIAATAQLEDDVNALVGLVDEAEGQLAIENGIDGTPPHLHYWLDQDISDYHRHMEYARRLTYLALRALEYEAQQSVGHRDDILTARRPEDLGSVCDFIDGWTSPDAGGIGRATETVKVAMSLRDEILEMQQLARFTSPLGTTAEQAFKAYLQSDAAKMYDRNGNYLGRGIRFSLNPDSWGGSEFACAERIWRIQDSLVMDNPPNQHSVELYQENTFGGQTCTGNAGDVTMSRANVSTNLLTGDAAAYTSPSSYTSITIDGVPGLDHDGLRQQPEGDASGLAGRGMYGNYVLLFGKQTWPDPALGQDWSTGVLSHVKDVLIRIDIVDANHGGDL